MSVVIHPNMSAFEFFKFRLILKMPMHRRSNKPHTAAYLNAWLSYQGYFTCKIFTGFLSVIIVRTVRRDIAQYNKGEELVSSLDFRKVIISQC